MSTRRNMTNKTDIKKTGRTNKSRQTSNRRMTRSLVQQEPIYIEDNEPCSSKPSSKRTATKNLSFGSRQDAPICLDDSDYLDEPSSSTDPRPYHHTNETESLDIADTDIHMSSDIECYLHADSEATTFDELDPNLHKPKESYPIDDQMNRNPYKTTPTKVSKRNYISKQVSSKVTKKSSKVAISSSIEFTKSTKKSVGVSKNAAKASEQGSTKRLTRNSTTVQSISLIDSKPFTPPSLAATDVGFASNSSDFTGPDSTDSSQCSTDPIIFIEPRESPAVNFALLSASTRSAQLAAMNASANKDKSPQNVPNISPRDNTTKMVRSRYKDSTPIRCSKRTTHSRAPHAISKSTTNDSIRLNEPAVELQPESKVITEKDISINIILKSSMSSSSRSCRRTAAEIAVKAITKSVELPLYTVNDDDDDDDTYKAPARNTGFNGGETRPNGDEYLQMILNDPVLATFRVEVRGLVVDGRIIGEGQTGIVTLGSYHGLPVACKTKRARVNKASFYSDILREITFAQMLKFCRFTNKYIGWAYCESNEVEPDVPETKKQKKLYLVQRFIENGDARSYINNRAAAFGFFEVLQAALCLFTALNDIHGHDIGLVDLKLENFLIDHSGSGLLTDFGSSINFHGREKVDLDEEQVAWTVSVSAPEMIRDHEFTKASDVFMATMIISELMTAELSDSAFRKKVLRRKTDGDVSFSPEVIDPCFSKLFGLLELGLANDPADRPTAGEMLKGFIQVKQNLSAA